MCLPDACRSLTNINKMRSGKYPINKIENLTAVRQDKVKLLFIMT